jgi:hypothetical protein
MKHLPTRTVWIAAAVLALAACGEVFTGEDKIADEARVELTGDSPVDLELVTSTKFTRTRLEDGTRIIILQESDTAMVRPDYEATVSVAPDRGFYAGLKNDSDEVAEIVLRVFFDGKLSYEQPATIAEGGLLEYVYLFN